MFGSTVGFTARARNGVFKSLSHLQVILSASRNKIQRSVARNASRDSEAGGPRPTVLGLAHLHRRMTCGGG